MNLYAMNDAIMMAFHKAVDHETGEVVDEEMKRQFDNLSMDFDKKVEGILLWIKNLDAEAKALKEAKLSFAERQADKERKAESLRKYVSGILNGQDFETKMVRVSWRKSCVAEFDGNIYDLPGGCVRWKPAEIDKNELKKLLKSGATIKGAKLVEKNNMQIK